MNTTIHQVAINVLKSKGLPLTIREIFDEIIVNDFYQFKAINPLDVLTKIIRKHCDGIDFPSARKQKYFQITKDRRYWIYGTPVPGQTKEQLKLEVKHKKNSEDLKNIVHNLRLTHSKYIEVFKKVILQELQEMSPEMFEIFSKKLLDIYGFKKMKVTSYVKDGGIDGYGELKVGITHLNVAFQSKRWKNNSVGRVEIDKFRGAIQGEFEQGIIFTTSKFTKDALSVTRKPGAVPIILIDGESLIDIMIDKKFGIEIEPIAVYINALDNILE